MSSEEVFPVLPDDDGIRPAGKPDQCFFCQRKVGEPHDSRCVTIVRSATYEVKDALGTIALYTDDEPSFWNDTMGRFHRNEASWCTGNMLVFGHLQIIDMKRWRLLVEDSDENCICFQVTLEPIGREEEKKRCRQ